MMDINETIKDIRNQCRMAMNGIASTSMRQQGLTYKLNFGVSIQKIKEICNRYEANQELAENLWHTDVRELKILATLLYPISMFNIQTAEQWVRQILNQEIREQICLNLFQNLEFAEPLSLSWANSADENIRTSGYWLLVRLIITKKIAHQIDCTEIKEVFNDLTSENTSLKNAAILTLKHIGRQSENIAKEIIEKVRCYENSENIKEKEIFDNLNFEFEYYFETK